MLAVYFLIFLARHEKEFSEVYSKMEKTEFIRDETGRILDVADKTPRAARAVWYAIPLFMTIPVSYTHLPSPRDLSTSRMPSSA